MAENCRFCDAFRIGNGRALKSLLPAPEGQKIPCSRWIYNRDGVLGTLAPEQYTRGHTLVILKSHRNGITDPSITSGEHSALMSAITRISIAIKNVLNPDQVSLVCLCEETGHLHFHLIPRYSIYSHEEMEFFVGIHEMTGRVTPACFPTYGPGLWYLCHKETLFHLESGWKGSNYENGKYRNYRDKASGISTLARSIRRQLK